MGENSVPGFRRISCVDAYLFKMVYIFAPFLFLLVLYNVVTGRPAEDSILAFIFLAVLVGVIYFRWSAIVAAFNDHVTSACRIANISPGGGLLGLHIFVSFFVSCDGENAERGCSLVRFNPRVKKLKKGDVINVFWNQRKNMYVIKEAYLDD
jgi:hypothetical protein